MTPTILVVDDDPSTCTLIERTLTQQGYAVSTVADGQAALATAAAHRPDLVIADVLLPGLDGLMVIDLLRQHNRLLPVIAMSAVPEVLVRQEAVPAGLDLGSIPFLAKPFALATLMALVQSLVPLLLPN